MDENSKAVETESDQAKHLDRPQMRWWNDIQKRAEQWIQTMDTSCAGQTGVERIRRDLCPEVDERRLKKKKNKNKKMRMNE